MLVSCCEVGIYKEKVGQQGYGGIVCLLVRRWGVISINVQCSIVCSIPFVYYWGLFSVHDNPPPRP